MNNKIKTIKDIANELDISPSTVSRVLNKKGYYSEEVEKKVMELVEKSGFVYNMSAKSLRNSKSYTIGLMIPDISNTFFGSLALIIEEYFNKRGYSLFICNTHTNPKTEFKQLSLLASNKVDGILCISQLTKIPPNFEQHNIPIVSLDRYPLCNIPVTKIVSNEYEISYQIAELLLSKNCKNIIILSAKDEHFVVQKDSLVRISGFVDCLKQHGIDFSNENIISADLGTDNALFESEAVVNSLIASGKKFDAIYALTDRFALGALYALNNAGIKVPEEVKIIGYDNSTYSFISRPPLSSVDRNLHLMATTACDKLLELINSENKIDNSKIIIPATIIERASTN